MSSRDITPISFKTVPGRNRTQKWSKAPTQTYDGDDWGGYDPYDDSEYSEPPPPMPTSQLPRDPYNGSPQLARASSFDRGDESRQFSAGQPSHFAGKDVNRQPSPATPQQHATPKDLSSSGSRPRDPEQVPPPLTANSPRASAEQFPPRRSSRSSGTPSLPATTFSPPTRETSPAVDKPLPFIRPADIYKRHAEELRRQSEDGIRPSLDSLSREKSPPPLDSVAENRESRMYETEEQPSPERLRVRDTSPTLPLVTRFSGFGTDFLTGSLGAGIGGHALNDGSSSSNTQAIADRVTSAPVVRADEPSSLQHTPTSAERDSAPAGLGNTDNADLQHRPSKGFRSAVDTAFDRNDDEISRDNSASSQQGSGEISPIMSRVPSGATATLERKRMEEQMPSIAETTPAGSRPASDSRGRVVSGDFEPGYRRSMDPPSTGSSPARTPALDNTANRRLSTPLSAVPMDAESADVLDQGAEMRSVTLEPTENSKPLAIKTRGRSGTDYSMRESDIANEINASSPDTGGFSPALLAAQKNDQALFLETHSDLKAPPSPMSPGGRSPGGKSQDGSRAGSPSKGRVREIADKFSGLDDAAGSRRNSAISVGSSKSSWSNFGEPRQGLSRPDTNRSLLGNEVERPGVQREESFVPDVPGGWISSAPTPEPGTGREPQYPQATPRAQRNASDEDIDLTPTTKKHQLRGSGSHQDSPTTLEQVKNAGAQLGASLLSATGIGHQTRDFASSESAAPREETPEPRMIRGDQPMQPPMYRHDTENSEAPTSIASSMPPTPISKETPAGETLSSDYFKAVAPLRVKSREATPPGSREGGLRPQVTSAYPSEMGPGDMESDRLRKEIVRSLDPIPHDEAIEDTQRTQDALDAPTNERRVEQGLPTLPAAETSRQPGLLQTRFSWEAPSAPELVHSPEIKPEMPYERGTSKTLHVMNVGNETPDTPTVINPTQQESEDGVRDESYLSPITEADGSMPPASPRRSLQDVPPSPMSTHDRSHINDDAHAGSGRISSDARQSSDARHSSDARNASLDAPASSSPISHKTAPPPVRTSAQQPHKPIPPFRSILALKTSEDRIASYNETRTTFAEMNTGLSDWLRAMSAQHSDITAAPLGPPPALGVNTGAGSTSSLPSGFLKGHKNSPSLAKFTRNFSGSGTGLDSGGPGSSSAGPVGGQRNVSSSSGAPAQDGDISRPAIDTEELKLKGKAFMQKTGVLGGKAQAGAKGLFAKGRSRFGGGGGGEKVPKSSSASSPSSSAKFLRRLSSQPQVQPSPSATHPPTIPAAAAPATGSTATLPTKVSTSNPSALPAPRAVASAAPIVSSAAVVKVGDLPLTTSTSVAADAPPVPEVSSGSPPRDAGNPLEEVDNVEDESAFEGFDGEFTKEDGSEHSKGNGEVDVVDEEEGARGIAQPAQEDGRGVDADKRVARGDKHGAETIPAYVVRDSTIASAADPLVQGTTSAPLPAKKDAESAAVPPFATHPVEELFTTSIPASLADAATITTPASNTTPTTQSPVHANRPRLFARHSSSRSISSLPGKTAKESSPSRPLSMLFGDWMREKSRSRSRSRSSKSATGSQGVETPASQPRSSLAVPKSSTSRPSSLVLHESAAEDGPTAGHGNAERPFVLSDFSDVAVRATAPDDDAGPMSPMSQNREEAWNSPDATLPLASPAAEGKAVGRLGVLPSPAPTAATFESGRRASMEPSRRRSSAAPLKFLDEDGKPAVVLEPVPSEDSVLQEDNGGAERDLSSPPAVGPAEPARSALRKVSEGTGVHDGEKDEDEKKSEEVVMKARPQHQRKVSDRERLPSQLAKRLSEGRPRPDSMVLAHLNFGSEESWGGLKTPGDRKEAGMTAEPDTIVSTMGEGDVGAGPPTTEKRASKLLVEPEARDDARSEVSAEHPQEGEGPQPSTRPSTSRRSSVSSLGVVAGPQIDQPLGMSLTGAQVADVEPSAASPNGTVQSPASIEQPAVAKKPAFGSSESMLSPQRPMMDDRGMSYTILPRDASGLPVPETITTAAQTGSLQQTASAGPQASAVPVDLSVMGGPPAGTPPFQQHPLFRSAEQERNGAQDTVTKESGLVQRSASQQAQRDNGFGGAPPPNQITDDHGLDDIYAFNQVTSDVQPKEEADAHPGDKQGKRRSMIWDTLKHRRQASFRKGEDGSRHNSMVATQPEGAPANTAAVNAPAAEEAKSETPRRATLQQPLRTQAIMAEKATRKKRFSALGSIFGRSGTPAPGSPKVMADNSPSKPKKLTKAAPSEREAMAQSPVMNKRAADGSTVSGNIKDYDQYEAARKRDMPAYQDTASNAQRQAPQPRLPNLESSTEGRSAQPPSEGWYGSPTEDEPSQRTIPPPQAGQPMPVHRRMHSEGGHGYRAGNHVPESFTPVEASYNARVDPVGPPSSQDTQYYPVESGYGQRRSQDHGRFYPYGAPVTGPPPHAPRQLPWSDSMDIPTYDQRQVGGQPQYHPPYQRGPYGPPDNYGRRPSRELARNPAHEYAEQQPPWAVAIPSIEQASHDPRSPQWTTSAEGQYSSPDAAYYQQQQYPQQRPPPPSRPSSTRPYPPVSQHNPGRAQMYDNPPPRSQTAGPEPQSEPRRFSFDSVGPHRPQNPPRQSHEYERSRQRPASTQYPPQTHYSRAQPPPPRAAQPRYYAQQQSPQNYAPHASFGAFTHQPPRGGGGRGYPPYSRRPSSGYSGRRDDPTVGEEEVIMRGASYPGQEWTPMGMGKWD